MGDRGQSAISPGAHPHPLALRGAKAHKLKDLLPGHGHLHRLVQLAGGERRQDGFRVNAELGAEPPSDIRRDNANLPYVDPERARDRGTSPVDDLDAQVDRQLIVMPDRERGLRLHRLGELVRCRVQLVELDLRAAEPGVEIAHRGVGLESAIH